MSITTKFFAVVLIVFGLLITGGVIIQIDEGTYENSLLSELMLMSLFGLLPLAIGAGMFWYDFSEARKKNITEKQVRLLQKAQSSGGKITISEAAVALQVSINEAKEQLDDLQAKGIFEIAISQEGTLEYIIAQELGHVKMRKGSRYV